ncbi:MAG: hypothetical protein IKF97_01330 [Clostridia bacterium]|nr:hypothetical protein [Clostridia bacterium]
MYFIEKTDKPTAMLKLLKIIQIKEDKILLPIEKQINEKVQIKLAEKTHKLLQKTNSNKLVLSKEIKKFEIYVNKLHSYGYIIVDGKLLFEALETNILDFITSNKNIKKEETKLSVLVNDLSDYTLQNIKKLATEYKALNIVTNHLEKFKKLEDIIYSENGLMITVSNNKKKSLIQSNLILNIDFPQELINKYNINDDAIIVSVLDDIKINKKRFNGLIVNDYEVKTNKYIDEKYYIKELYEAEIYNGIPYLDLMKKIKDDNVKIKALYGLNGKIF